MEEDSDTNISSTTNTILTLLSTEEIANITVNLSGHDEEEHYKRVQASKTVVLATFLVILVVGTVGNLLSFIVMQRGSLKKSSTCFYMAMLAVADSSKFIVSLCR